jgi:HSP20 family protein
MLERWNPLAELDRMVDEMNRVAEALTARPRLVARLATRPATDVYETEDAVVIKLAAPGAKPEDLEVTIEQGTVTVRGRFGYSLSEDEAKKATWYRREIGAGQFAETITLPRPVDADKAEATVADGIVTLVFPKAETARVKRITIQSRAN